MTRRRWVVLIAIALVLTAAISNNRARQPVEAAAEQCLGVYADELPRDAMVRNVRQDGSNLVVYVQHLGWEGQFRCVLYRDGSLDEAETKNRRIEVLWSEPPMPSNP